MKSDSLNSRSPNWLNQLAARPGLLIAISAAFLLLLISPNWKPDQDSVAYLSMARSFAAGRGMLHLGLHQWHYAPLYSVVIRPAFWSSHWPFLVISLVNVALGWSLILGTFVWFRRYSRKDAALVAALVGVNVGLWDVCREPRSEVLFSTLLIWGAVLFAKAADCRALNRFAIFTAVGTIAILAAVFTRQVGLFLGAGFVVAMAVRWLRGRVLFSWLLLAFVPGIVATSGVIFLIVRDHQAARLDHVPIVVTYTEQYRQPNATLGAQLLDGVRRQTADVGRLLLPGMWGSFAHFGQWLNFNTILYVVFTIPVIIGWWQITRRTCDPLLCTVPFYAAMFVVWPFDQGTRFNVPMLPVLWACVWMMLRRWPRQRRAILAVILCLHLIASLIYLARDTSIVRRWNKTIPPMAELSQKVTTSEPAALRGGAPNDLLIWRYLLDRPVLGLPKNTMMLPSQTIWLVQSKASPAPPGFERVENSSGVQLDHRQK